MGRGALVFKGDSKSKKKKSSKKKHSKRTEDNVVATQSSTLESGANVAASVATGLSLPNTLTSAPQQRSQQQQQKLVVKEGSGGITTSGTVVTGHNGTRFEKELSNGDAIVVAVNGQEEMRVVTMRLSNVSCALSSAFSQNLKSPTEFSIIPKPRDKQREAQISAYEKIVSKQEEEKQAFGTYGTNNELVYREVTEHGSYRIKRVKVDGQSTTR
eukprot:CAMPEP_0195288778 /NCGR_PEP_ID=MMETSP0707-20130614/5303_1 /TAXON_ID=33640 /ORGANISM="Asterionellopsis glacialis, Strain CCMP134" /LENGTH=213 /DNA_ID=CAMNT_0040348681 /DNA_START=116 /DNA_END=753 /DNA_ORIENTATION=-